MWEYRQALTVEAAGAECKKIVDEFLPDNNQSGMRAADLSSLHVNFGEDPFINGPEVKTVLFSAWNYVRERCREICVEAL